MAVLNLDLPDDFVATLDTTEVAAMREAAVVKLYDLGRISSGKAVRVLDISRRAFLEVLGRYGVSEFDDTMDVAAEARLTSGRNVDGVAVCQSRSTHSSGRSCDRRDACPRTVY